MARSTVAFSTLAVLLAAGNVSAREAQPAKDKPPWGALTDTVGAAEIVLRDVCLPGILEQKPIGELAVYEHMVPMPSRLVNAGPADKVWRLASLGHTYAVAWADGSCSTYSGRGAPDALRAMAERTILARPEGFVVGRSSPEDDGRVLRTVYCARIEGGRLVATITTPLGKAGRKARALSSTVYRAPGWSNLCEATPPV